MGESETSRDFMLIAIATRADDAFHSRVHEAVRLAAARQLGALQRMRHEG